MINFGQFLILYVILVSLVGYIVDKFKYKG